VIIYENKILDGRNRYLACQKAGIEPRFEQFTGNNPLDFVISTNLHQRNLYESQRAVIAKRLANMPLGGDIYYRSANLPTGSISQAKAAEMLNVRDRSIRTVAAVERAAPDLIPYIESGGITAYGAKRIIDTPEVFEPLKAGGITIEEAKQATSKAHVAYNSGNNERRRDEIIMEDKENIINRIMQVSEYLRGDRLTKVDAMSLRTQALFIATHLNKPKHMPLDSIFMNEKIRHSVVTGEMKEEE
jgi:hypothetical protein